MLTPHTLSETDTVTKSELRQQLIQQAKTSAGGATLKRSSIDFNQFAIILPVQAGTSESASPAEHSEISNHKSFLNGSQNDVKLQMCQAE